MHWRTDILSTSTDDPPGTPNIKARPKTSEVLAVALAKSHKGKNLPHIVAGGRGKFAEQILEIAFASGVKVREDADLAQLLSSIDPESDIPVEALGAVAEILVYLYRANAGKEGTSTDDFPADSETGDTPSIADFVSMWSKEIEKNE